MEKAESLSRQAPGHLRKEFRQRPRQRRHESAQSTNICKNQGRMTEAEDLQARADQILGRSPPLDLLNVRVFALLRPNVGVWPMTRNYCYRIIQRKKALRNRFDDLVKRAAPKVGSADRALK